MNQNSKSASKIRKKIGPCDGLNGVIHKRYIEAKKVAEELFDSAEKESK